MEWPAAISTRRSYDSDETPRAPSRGIAALSSSEREREREGSSKRLAIFGDKLSSQSPAISRASPVPSQPHLLQPPPRTTSHSRRDSSLSLNSLRDATASPLLMASGTPSKVHQSPSKGSTRTYDAKLVSREMHRLGNLAHLPSSLAPALSSSSSVTLNATPMPPANSTSNSSADNPWGMLHVLVLPLFNGEPLRVPIEDLNTLVKRHIQTVMSNPSKAISTLEAEASELIASGMDTLNGKLAGLDDEKLVARVVGIWGFFWDQVLPYVEGVLLPLQTEPILATLYRTPKTHRNSSPSRQNGKGSMNMTSHLPHSPYPIDVRTLALRSFRDKVILPLFSQLNALLNSPKQSAFTESHTYPRLQQMLLVLVSQGRRPQTSLSLTAPAPQPTPGEAAVTHLLLVVRASTGARLSLGMNHPRQARAPSFLSAAIPRDRRGRIAQRPRPRPMSLPLNPEISSGDDLDELDGGGETPRTGYAGAGAGATLGGGRERERDREFLEALKSPDPKMGGNGNGNGNSAGTNGGERGRASMGGWGLGAFNEEGKDKDKEEDEEEDQMDWDQAQAVVERMVGMKPNDATPTGPTHPEPRRRPT